MSDMFPRLYQYMAAGLPVHFLPPFVVSLRTCHLRLSDNPIIRITNPRLCSWGTCGHLSHICRYISKATIMVYGLAVTTKKDGTVLQNRGYLGLRIRLPNGNGFITTQANTFVRLLAMNDVSRILYQVSDWLVRTARLLHELAVPNGSLTTLGEYLVNAFCNECLLAKRSCSPHIFSTKTTDYCLVTDMFSLNKQ